MRMLLPLSLVLDGVCSIVSEERAARSQGNKDRPISASETNLDLK